MRFSEQISALGERPFMVDNGHTFTYADLRREIERVGATLREKGIERGQIVALTGPYNFAAAVAFVALAETGNIVVPLVGADPKEVDAKMKEAGVEWGLDTGSTSNQPPATSLQHPVSSPHPLVMHLKERKRAGLILFSSGSTGKAKAMLHDLDTLIESYSPGDAKGLRVLAFMGLDHIGGLDIFFRAIASGSCLVVPRERFPQEICRLIEEEKVEVLPATPSFLNLMLVSDAHHGRDLESLKIIGFGAERMPEPVLRRLKEVFPNVRFQQKFGTSETNAIRTVSKETDPLWLKITDPGVEWRIVEGELWIKTPSRILGYLNCETDRLTADGWYRTGDLVDVDDEGFFRIVGRRESMINVGGEKVLPGEVEAVIGEVGFVRDCRVFAVENPLMGQVVGAEIVASDETDEKEVVRVVRRHCRTKLAAYKVPVKIEVVQEIAMTERFKRKI